MRIESFIYKRNLDIDFVPTLAFLFFEGDKKDILIGLYKKLKNLNPDMDVIAINGKRGNISSKIPYITQENKISCLFMDIDNSNFHIEILKTNKYFKKNFFKATNLFSKSAAVIFPPFRYDINNFLDSIDEDMYDVYGGVYGVTDEVGVFYNGEFYLDKAISVFFNQNVIEFFSIAIHGFRPIGIKFKVTKSKDNTIYEINNSPALDIIEEYIGEVKQENIDNFLHPFCVYHKGYESLASIKSINRKKKTISFYKYIYEGEDIRITIPSNQQTIMKFLDKRLKNIECDGLFMFSCVGRYAYYKELIEFEIAKVSELLKKPFAGFLTYGEIGSNDINTKSILQNQTMNLVFFKVRK